MWKGVLHAQSDHSLYSLIARDQVMEKDHRAHQENGVVHE